MLELGIPVTSRYAYDLTYVEFRKKLPVGTYVPMKVEVGGCRKL
jgi:hypothetical protein